MVGLSNPKLHGAILSQNDVTYVAMRDYFMLGERYGRFFPFDLDEARRIVLTDEMSESFFDKGDLRLVGFGDHLRLYAAADWEKVKQGMNEKSEG